MIKNKLETLLYNLSNLYKSRKKKTKTNFFHWEDHILGRTVAFYTVIIVVFSNNNFGKKYKTLNKDFSEGKT